MTGNELVKFLNYQHEAYDKNYYRIVAQDIFQNDKCSGILRCFTYRGNPRFAVLFETTPDNFAFDFSARWVKEKLRETGGSFAMLWYSQLKGFDDGLLKRLTLDGEPYKFLEIQAERQTEEIDIDLRGLKKVLYTPDMLEECIELLENSYTPFLDEPGGYRSDRERVMQMLENRNSARCELFFLNGSLIGLYAHNDGAMECICVSPALQGRGFGELILRSALNAVMCDTDYYPRLTVACKNTKAISLYKKCGFKTICESARVVVKI